MEEIQVTVVMTAYKRCGLIPRALDSLRAQTMTAWELVVVDDGSSDGTQQLIAARQADEPRIRYLYQENRGLAEARNTGLRAARAPVMTFLDSDDEYAPDHLAIRLDYLGRHPEVDLIHGGVQIVGGPDWVPDRNDPSKRIRIADCYVGGTFFMRRHVFEQLGGFRRPDYGDDYDFMCRALTQFRVDKVAAPTYIYHRETPDSMCNQMASEHPETPAGR